jgi:hypothetical protein
MCKTIDHMDIPGLCPGARGLGDIIASLETFAMNAVREQVLAPRPPTVEHHLGGSHVFLTRFACLLSL